MTLKEWNSLKPGDIIESLNGTPRMCLEGTGNGYAKLWILRRSWTGKDYCYKHKCDRYLFRKVNLPITRRPTAEGGIRQGP